MAADDSCCKQVHNEGWLKKLEGMPDFWRTLRKSLTPFKRNQIAFSQQWRCWDCRMLLPASFHIDHRIALRDGGTNEWCNLCAMCPTCHAQKSAYENERYADKKRESRSGKSKYFNPVSKFFNATTAPIAHPQPKQFITAQTSNLQEQIMVGGATKCMTKLEELERFKYRPHFQTTNHGSTTSTDTHQPTANICAPNQQTQ